ncbi:hypothetical protein PPSIR1_23329 [Plesiocystis pacifica SIR-1]|uniref:DUF1566 domain-containing protein n=2 Tax=Plesiocystis pacifica TaxID=191768 RepID=A6GC90_9BACT|nr:hypothetical protein PPSIR1_23329 [Plesiocystis pacifica SIR-1]
MFPAGQDIAVTLCCARADTALIQPVVERLESEGVWTNLVEGVAEDPFLLGSAIDEEAGACVFVICQSAALGNAEYRRLVGIHNARKGPRHALIGLSLDPEEPLRMVEAINSAIAMAQRNQSDESMSRGAIQTGASESSILRLRDVVGVTTIDAIGTDAEPPPTQRVTVRNRKERARAKEASETLEAKLAERRDKLEAARAARDKLPDAPKRPRIEQAKRRLARERRGSGSWFIAGFAGIAFLLLAVFALIGPDLGGDDSDTETTRSGAAAQPRAKQGAPPTVAGDDKAPGKALTTKTEEVPNESDSGADEPAATEDGAAIQAGEAAGSDESDSSGAAEAEPAQAEDTAEPADAEETAALEQPEPAPAPSSEDADVLAAAIAKGELQSLNLLVIAPDEGPSTWMSAANLCRNKRFQGVRGWRMPTLNELKALRKARMLGEERYWSATLARKHGTGKDHVYVFSRAVYLPEAVAKADEGVHAFCVLDRSQG